MWEKQEKIKKIVYGNNLNFELAFSVIWHPPPTPSNNSFSTPLGCNFANNLENTMRSEEPSHKISILWLSGFLDMFIHRSPKTALKNTQNSPPCSILKLTFREIFKNEIFLFSQFSRNYVYKNFHFMVHWPFWHVSLTIPENRTQKYPKPPLDSNLKLTFPEIFKYESFRFPQFSWNFVYKKFPFYGTLRTCFSVDPENRTQKYPKPPLSTSFWSSHSGKFSKIKVFVFLNILKFFFDLCLGSSDCLTNYWDILESVGKVVEKF